VQLRVVRNPNGTVTLSRFASESSRFTITLKKAAASLGVAATPDRRSDRALECRQ
jgi:hypothetical protein